MIESLEIERLKSIKEMKMDCKNFNLLVGTNSSGKSTILQAILLLSENIEQTSGLNGKLVSIGEFEEARCWNAIEKSIVITITTAYGEQKLIIDDEGSTYESDFPLASHDYKNPLSYRNGKLSYLSCNRIGAKDVYDKSIMSDSRVGIYGEFAVDFLRRHKDDELEKDICKFSGLYTLGGQVNGWLNYIIGASIRTEDITGTDVMKATYRVANQKETRPKNVGSGVSYLISILVLCLSSKKDEILLIENPEIHLHPLAQSRVCEFLYFIASRNRQIFVETHSDHLFNRIRVGVSNSEMDTEKVHVNFISLDSDYCTNNTVVRFGKRGRVENPQKDLFDQFDIDLNRMLGL